MNISVFFGQPRRSTRHGIGKATSLRKCRAPIKTGELGRQNTPSCSLQMQVSSNFPSLEHGPPPTIWVDQGGPHASAPLALNHVSHWHSHWHLYFGHATTENERWSFGIQQRDRMRAGALRILGDVLKLKRVSLVYAISPAS